MIFKNRRIVKKSVEKRGGESSLGQLVYPAVFSLMSRQNRRRFLEKLEAEVRAQDALWEYKHPTVQLLLFESQA